MLLLAIIILAYAGIVKFFTCLPYKKGAEEYLQELEKEQEREVFLYETQTA